EAWREIHADRVVASATLSSQPRRRRPIVWRHRRSLLLPSFPRKRESIPAARRCYRAFLRPPAELRPGARAFLAGLVTIWAFNDYQRLLAVIKFPEKSMLQARVRRVV